MKVMEDGTAVAFESLSDSSLVTVMEEVAAILAGRLTTGKDRPTEDEGRAAMELGRRLARTTDLIESALVGVVQTVDASGVIRASCYRSVKGWMTATFRCFGNGAGQRVMLSRELRRLSDTSKALASGDISADQAKAITRTTQHLKPEPAHGVEDQLLTLAQAGAGADEVARTGHIASFLHDPKGAIERARNLTERRTIKLWWDKYGALRGTLTLPPETGARLQHTLEDLGQRAGSADDRTLGQRNADALAALLDGATGTELIVWTTADTLADENSTIPAQLRPSGMPLPATDARRLADSATTTLRLLTIDGPSGLPTDIGRRIRAWTPAQRRLIQARDQYCVVDGCTIPAEYCDIDHIDPWETGGPTDIDNGACCCFFHNQHKAAHPDRYTVTHTTDGRPRYLITTPAH